MKVLIDLSFIRNADLSIGFSRVSVLLVSSFLKLRSCDDFILLIDNSSKDYFTARFSKCRIFSFDFKTVFWGSLHFWILKRKISKITKCDTHTKIGVSSDGKYDCYFKHK